MERMTLLIDRITDDIAILVCGRIWTYWLAILLHIVCSFCFWKSYFPNEPLGAVLLVGLLLVIAMACFLFLWRQPIARVLGGIVFIIAAPHLWVSFLIAYSLMVIGRLFFN